MSFSGIHFAPRFSNAALLSCMLFVTAAHAADRPKVRAELDVPKDQRIVLMAPARGVQIYTCQATSGAIAWSSATPDAVLTDYGTIVAHHYKGPTWEAADGSKVIGVVPPEFADKSNPAAIPWLKLKASGTGQYAKVAWVQRVDTVGGNPPPAADCTAASVGKEVRVDYTANYFFYAPGK